MLENIYKIKVRSNPNPRDLYPSERRYSSSIVLGLSVLFLTLGITSALMGTLVVRKLTMNSTEESFIYNETITNTSFEEDERLLKKVEKDLFYPEIHRSINLPAIISAGCFMMSFGHFLAGFTGLFAWKQWYVDNNITWFFLSSCFSTITSAISLLLITLTLLDCNEVPFHKQLTMSLGLTANIFITSLLGMVWSVVATNVSFKGMKNDYPDDIILSKSGNGRVEVSTIKKGNKTKAIPPDILEHFPTTGKFAKYFPKKESGNLPKAESNREYEERVEKFLSGQSGGDTTKPN